MPENSIEILGQKLSYPDNWQGVSSVFFVCTALITITYIFTTWITPEKALQLTNYASIQETKVNELSRANQTLLDQIGKLERELEEAVSNKTRGAKEIKAVKSEVSALQMERANLYENLDKTFKSQEVIVNSLSNKIGGQQQVQIMQQQQQQQKYIQQQQEQVQQQQKKW